MTNEIKIKQIILFNSASYGYLEMPLDKNIIINGDNNKGKTSILNSIQFLFLLENNLKNINNKFKIKSGKDHKNYTGLETYNYYFSDENSFIIFEIENFHQKFCILLYGSKKTELEYRRIIIDVEYEKIRELFIDSNEELVINKRKDIFFKLKKHKNTIFFKELVSLNDINEYLFTNKLNNKYCIIPFKNNSKNTVENFKLLFKSFFDINTMGKKDIIKLISDIIKTKNVKKNRDNLSFNISELENEYNYLKIELLKIDNLKYLLDKFTFIKEFNSNYKIELSNIEKEIFILYKKIILELNHIQKELDKNKIEREKNILIIEKLEYEIAKLIEDKSELGAIWSVKNKEFIKTKQNIKLLLEFLNINDISELEEKHFIFLQENYLNLIKKIELEKDKLLEENKKINNIFENLKNKNILIEKEKELEEKLQTIQKEINIYKSISMENNDLFKKLNKKEIIILKNIFIDDFLIKIIDFNDKDLFIKINSIIKMFVIEDEYLYLNNQKLFKYRLLDKSINSFEEKIKKLELEKENIILEQKYYKNTLSNLIKNTNKDELDIYKELNNNKIIIQKSEKQISILYNFLDNLKIYKETPNELLKIEKEGKLKLENIENKKSELEKRKEEQKDLIGINKNLYAELKSIETDKEKIETNDYILNILKDEDIATFDMSYISIEETNKILDTKIEYDSINNKLSNLYKNRIKLFDYIVDFVNYNIFEDIDSDIVKNYKVEKNLLYLIDKLDILYSNLNNFEKEINHQIEELAQETMNSIELLKEIKNDIKDFENNINMLFQNIQISNLKKIKFEFVMNHKLISILNKFNSDISIVELDNYSDHIKEINNYLLNISSNNKNEINIENLIYDIKYKVLQENIDKEDVFVEIPQSNGTETMIMVMFISILIKELYKDNQVLNLPIIIDEILNIDDKNLNSLLSSINKIGSVIIGATPSVTPELLQTFEKTIFIDNKELKYIINKNRRLLVTSNNPLNMFENIKLEN